LQWSVRSGESQAISLHGQFVSGDFVSAGTPRERCFAVSKSGSSLYLVGVLDFIGGRGGNQTYNLSVKRAGVKHGVSM
jgi:hypothetical protein